MSDQQVILSDSSPSSSSFNAQGLTMFPEPRVIILGDGYLRTPALESSLPNWGLTNSSKISTEPGARNHGQNVNSGPLNAHSVSGLHEVDAMCSMSLNEWLIT